MTKTTDFYLMAEREFLRTEIKDFGAGGKLISPSGEDITTKKLEELKARLEGCLKVLKSEMKPLP